MAILTFAMVFATVLSFPCNAMATDTVEFNGVYYFRNAYVNGSFIDVAESTNAKAVQTHSLVKTRSQTWTAPPIGNGYYKIRSNYSGYYLTVVNNSAS